MAQPYQKSWKSNHDISCTCWYFSSVLKFPILECYSGSHLPFTFSEGCQWSFQGERLFQCTVQCSSPRLANAEECSCSPPTSTVCIVLETYNSYQVKVNQSKYKKYSIVLCLLDQDQPSIRLISWSWSWQLVHHNVMMKIVRMRSKDQTSYSIHHTVYCTVM